MKIFRLPPAFALALFAGGCALIDTPYTRPDAVTPEAWLGGQGVPESKIDVAWWESFGSPELTKLIAQDRTQSFDIRAASARVRQADAQARIAGAPLLPEVGLTLDASRNRSGGGRNGTVILPGTTTGGAGTTTGTTTGTTGTTTTTASSSRIYNSFTGRLNASYEIDFWGRNASNARSARALVEASRYDRETVTLTTTASVANTYFALVALRERSALARQNLEAAEQLLKAIRLRAENGLANALDLAQQENLVATQRVLLPNLELQFAQNRDALAVLLGVPPQKLELSTEAAALDAIALPEITPGLPAQLLTRRPDVANAEAQLQSANADINAARAAFFPGISLTASRGYASTALNTLLEPESVLWSLAAGATQTIFDNGGLFGQFDFQKARYEELLENYRKTAVSSFADVEDALAATRLLGEQEEGQKEALRTADLAFGYAQRQFKEGVVDITIVLNTQRALFTARDAYAQARMARLQAAVGLYRALGGGWNAEASSAPKNSTKNPAAS